MVDPQFDAPTAPHTDRIRAVRHRHRALPRVVYSTLTAHTPKRLVELGTEGLGQIVPFGLDDDPNRLRHLLELQPGVRLVLGQLLARDGFDRVLAKTTAEAESHLSDSIALLLLDFRISGGRGDLFFHYASNQFPLLRRRTVFLTGDTSAEVEVMVGHTAGLLRHKPFVNASLMSLLWSLVEPEARHPAPTP